MFHQLLLWDHYFEETCKKLGKNLKSRQMGFYHFLFLLCFVFLFFLFVLFCFVLFCFVLFCFVFFNTNLVSNAHSAKWNGKPCLYFNAITLSACIQAMRMLAAISKNTNHKGLAGFRKRDRQRCEICLLKAWIMASRGWETVLVHDSKSLL